MSKFVEQILTPSKLDYLHTASPSLSRFLLALQHRQILASKCPSCTKVYVPLRASCPACAVRITEEVELAHTGVVTTFCVVNIPFEGQVLTPPYACAHVLLDGADVQLFHLIGNCDVSDVRMGLRVQALWVDEGERVPSLEAIRFFEPTGKPDLPFEEFGGYL